uniref:RBR-type E3 ubiquitin transferase n=1 Tax=Saccoglossus kowalevskii TaxID=10224 RepID=A0ABM0MHT7_SACKO|nr:PREDICTED: probable E3 ubiquitin-protein ligase RNF144A-like [Saccoglossus kowalevskii]
MATSSSIRGCSDLAVDPMISCKLCLLEQPLHNMHQMQQCSCIYCLPCLKRYLTILITEGCVSIITCPDASCKERGKLHSNEIKKLVAKDTYDKYLKYKFSLEVDRDPNRTWCPAAGCETVCHVCTGEFSKPKHVHCPTCGSSFCSPVQGNMACRSDDDFLLRHYDKGPCRDKLGHSRASVIWHRTQVVGIFAGFGVLLLVASPFLLLAAPCILCCKCKVCRCWEDDDDGISGLPS